jgi:translocation and assembly module TamA
MVLDMPKNIAMILISALFCIFFGRSALAETTLPNASDKNISGAEQNATAPEPATNQNFNREEENDPYLNLHDFHYRVDFVLNATNGIFDLFSDLFSGSAMEEEVESLRIFKEQDKTVSNMMALIDRIKADVSILYKKAHTLGFYGADIKYKTWVQEKNKVLVTIYVDLGKIFKLQLNVKYLHKDEAFHKKYAGLLEKKLANCTGSIADIKSIIDAAVYDLQSDGFFEPEAVEKRVRLDYESRKALLKLTINPREKSTFHYHKIEAFFGIETEFIENRIQWEQGEVFDIRKIEKTSEDLKNTQIFSSIKIEPIKEEISGNNVPILIKLEEDKKHTIDFSLLYSGLRNMNYEKRSEKNKKLKSIIARLSWIRYNAFGNGEKLRLTVEGTPTRVREKRADYAFEAALLQPDVFIKNNSVEYLCSRRQELTNIFFKKNDKFSLIFDYPIWFFTGVRAGCSFEKNYLDGCPALFRKNEANECDNKNKYYDNLTFPLEFVVDKTDDLLNPTSGYRALLGFSHMLFKNSHIKNLNAMEFNFSYNHPLDEFRKTVAAFSVNRKMLFGKDIDDIPIDKRIYAGGMNSIRGYAKQMATEKTINYDTHMGGKSSVEFKAEIRRKIYADFGVVAFFDGAKILQNQSKNPDLEIEKKRWFLSYGLGFRYFTSIGPIRIDFAFPIKRRKHVDSKMQFIISLGQAF